MRKNKHNSELYTALPELYRELPNDYVYQLVKIIFQNIGILNRMDAFYNIRKSSKKITNMDIWFALRSVYKYCRTTEINFDYKKHFRFPEIFNQEMIITHLHKMYESFILERITWEDLAKDKDLLVYYLVYLDAFIRSLYNSDFGCEYSRIFQKISEELDILSTEDGLVDSVQTLLIPQIPLKDMH